MIVAVVLMLMDADDNEDSIPHLGRKNGERSSVFLFLQKLKEYLEPALV